MVDVSKPGIYMAYPTSEILKPIYRGYKTKVNRHHTKVGRSKDPLSTRAGHYKNTFDGEVVFEPLANFEIHDLEQIESAIKAKLRTEFRNVGRAREWFDTSDHETVRSMVMEVIRDLS